VTKRAGNQAPLPLYRAGVPVRNATFWLALAVLLAAALLVRLVDLEADPPTDVGQDLSLSTDGSWYTARALDGAIGRDCDAPESYDRPVYTAYAALLFRLFGPSLATANLISVPPAILAVLFTALLARRLAGNAAGLIGAALLAFNYSFSVFNRSPVIYTFLAMVGAAVLLLAVTGSQTRRPALVAAAWILWIAGVVSLKEVLLLLLPALLLVWPLPELARKRPRLALAALTLAAAAATGAAFALDLHHKLAQKLADYLGDCGAAVLAERALDLESRSGFFGALLLVAPIALLAGLRRRLGREETALLVTATAGPLAFAPFHYSPLRYFLVLFPVFTALAAAALSRFLAPQPDSGEPTPARSRWLRAPLVLYFAWQLARALWPSSSAAALATWAPAAIALLAFTAGWSPRVRARLAAAAVALAVAASLAADFLHTSAAYAQPSYTIRHALEEVDAVVSRSAILSGLFSHLLTTENRLERRLVSAARFGRGELRRTYEARGVTHLTIDGGPHVPEILARFAADGAPLTLVHTFHIRGTAVHLLRFEYGRSTYQLSDYEHGVEALESGRLDEAFGHFEDAARRFPHLAAPRSALAALQLQRGLPSEALRDAERALALNPWDFRASGVKAELLLRKGEIPAARELLERMHELDPQSTAVAETLARLDAAAYPP
jgi:tetratricopeptide (TPR) repeat protein